MAKTQLMFRPEGSRTQVLENPTTRNEIHRTGIHKTGKKRTRPITFRLPEELIEEIRKEAEDVQISLNTLVNQVFNRYVRWERHGNKIGLIPMTRPFLKRAVQHLPEGKLKQIAHNSSKDALKELVYITKGSFTLDSFLSVFNEWLRASFMTHKYEYDGGGHHYIIHHDLGEKWSFYLSELLTAICKDLGNGKPETEIRRYSMSASFQQASRYY